MRILLIGDPHFKVDNAYESDQMINEIYKLTKKNKYDKIVILGDILDTHEKIHMRPFCRAMDFITTLSQNFKVYVLIGNHDRINNSVYLTEEHPFTGLKNKKNIYIIDKVFREEDILYVPYVPTGRFQEAIEDFEKDYKIIIAHQEFKGSIFQDQGDDIPKDVAIYSGHIHNYRKIKNLTYVGTPFQHSFYDNPDKFLLQLDIDDEEIMETKISLDIIKKRVEEIEISKLASYKVDEKFLTKLIIKGDRKLLKSKEMKILKHPQITYKISYSKGEIKDLKKLEKKEIKFEEMLKERLDKESKVINVLFERIKKKIK